MKKKIRRIIEILLGTLLILLGIAGLVLPFLQGIVLIVAGITLVSPNHGKKIFRFLKEKWHSVFKK